MSEETDVKDLDQPQYVGGQDSEKLQLRIREFAGTEPVIIDVEPNWTVEHTELKFARAKGKNPRSVRFTVRGQPLPKDARIASLSSDILDGRTVIEAAPEHGLGRTLPAGLPASIIETIKPLEIKATDFERIRTELKDLPYKEGYGKQFKVKVKSLNKADLAFPSLYILFVDRWYRYRLVLLGYPYRITGYFVRSVPSCPQHGGKHPHVFDDKTFCWEIERNWKPSMTIVEDYIQFMLRALYNPREHIGCKQSWMR